MTRVTKASPSSLASLDFKFHPQANALSKPGLLFGLSVFTPSPDGSPAWSER
jgi:hypothetical protein